MAPPTAIVTGASSGIGLALTMYLKDRGWAVILADLNPPHKALPNTFFIKTDISSWDQQAALFKQAYEWQGRLDFFAANAGIDDRDDIFASIASDEPPRQPNLKTFEVNVAGTYYGIKLAAHYMSLNSTAADKLEPGGKIVVTSSAAGIYPLPVVPQYTASKHALVGLVRSMAPVAAAVNIKINALCPALVQTGLAPPGLLDSFKPEQFTPMSTMLKCFEELTNFDAANEVDWAATGKTGEVVEGNLDKLLWHSALQRPAASSYQDEEGEKAWARAYTERNKSFALQNWINQK